MQLFFHNVGLDGATRDFPKTVFKGIPIAVAEKNIPVDAPYREEVIQGLRDKFPSGSFNCWGVPPGAESAIKHLNAGDVMLLVKTIGGEYGEIPALGIVKVFVKEQMRELSQVLWGKHGYPYVFFFDTESISLTWTKFKEDVGYKPNYRPPGYVSRVAKLEKLQEKFYGVQGYLDFLRRENTQQRAAMDVSFHPSLKHGLEETSPPSSRPRQKRVSEKFKTYKMADYSASDAKNRELGLAGELQVLNHEQEHLKIQGCSDLAQKVRHVSQVDGDGAGYDILSYMPDGKQKYIEVKTTTGAPETPFYITSNEVAFSEQHSSNYYIYRVYNFDMKTNTGKFYIKIGSIACSFDLVAVEYRATIL
jgi:hypothetical protein